MKNTALVIIFLLVICAAAGAQSYPASVYYAPGGRQRTEPEVNVQKVLYDSQRANAGFNRLDTMRDNRVDNLISPLTFSWELMSQAKPYVAPSAEIQAKYQDFLKSANTGIVKLFSSKACPENKTGKKENFAKILKRCAPDFILGKGRYYSFWQKEYVEYNLADIGYKDNWFFSFGILTQGIFVALGDTPIQDLSLTSKGVDYLAGYKPAVKFEGIVKESQQFEQGFKVNDFDYKKFVSIEKDKTYALRVVAYNVCLNMENPKEKSTPTKIYPLEDDKREDLIVVFRVVEKNETGDLVLLWKELQRIQSPEMVITVLKRN